MSESPAILNDQELPFHEIKLSTLIERTLPKLIQGYEQLEGDIDAFLRRLRDVLTWLDHILEVDSLCEDATSEQMCNLSSALSGFSNDSRIQIALQTIDSNRDESRSVEYYRIMSINTRLAARLKVRVMQERKKLYGLAATKLESDLK